MPFCKILFIIFLMSFSTSGRGQDFSRQFDALTIKRDTAKQAVLLRKWEKLTPRDPELFTSYFNYYVEKSIKKATPPDLKKLRSSTNDSSTSGNELVVVTDSTLKRPPSLTNDTDIIFSADIGIIPDAGKKAAGTTPTVDAATRTVIETKAVANDTGKNQLHIVGQSDSSRKPSGEPNVAKSDTIKPAQPQRIDIASIVKTPGADTVKRSALNDTTVKVTLISVADTTKKAELIAAITDTATKKPVENMALQPPADAAAADTPLMAAIDTTVNESDALVEDSIQYDTKYLKKAFEYINKGIAIYPNRIDMRFSKIYILSQYKDYDWLTKEIIKTLEYSSRIKNAWFETDNKRVQDPQNFMLDVIQDFIGVLFEVGIKQADNIRSISETALKYYPKHVQSITNIATVYVMTKNYEKGLAYFEKAEKLAPNDCILLSDMAAAYLESKNEAKAIAYYSKVIKYGNRTQQETAKEQLVALQKN
jgi:tetratricopeptide (TPR) repeat protein